MKSVSIFSARSKRLRVALIVVLMACGCTTDSQLSRDHAAFRGLHRCFETARLALRGERQRSITCFVSNSVVKRKDEQRECKFDTDIFRKALCELRTRCLKQEELFLIISAPDHLIELPGTPPPPACC